jgi:hypothetical protein
VVPSYCLERGWQSHDSFVPGPNKEDCGQSDESAERAVAEGADTNKVSATATEKK